MRTTYEYEIKKIIKDYIDKATDEIDDLKGLVTDGIYGEETIMLMTEAAYAVFKATMEAQDYSLKDGRTKLQ